MEKAFSHILKELGFKLAGPDYARGRFPIASGKYGHQTIRPLEADKPALKQTAAVDENGHIWTKAVIENLKPYGFVCETAPLAVELALILKPLGFEAVGKTFQAYAHQYFIQRAGSTARTIAYDERGVMYSADSEILLPDDLFALMN